jgi:predicted acyl esterase
MRALAPGSTSEEPLEKLTSPKPIKPGRFYTYEISIAPTAYTFKPGHRLQIRITSGNLPNALPGTLHLDLSNPTAPPFTPLPPATNTIRLGGRDGTSLLLPVYRPRG